MKPNAYTIKAYMPSGDVAYSLIVNNEKDMLLAVKDALYDGFAPFVMPNYLEPKAE